MSRSARGITRQDALILGAGAASVVTGADDDGIGQIQLQRLRGVKGSVEEVLHGAGHGTGILWRDQQQGVTLAQIIQPRIPGTAQGDLAITLQ